MCQVNDLIQRLESCPVGMPGWSQFENICTEILTYLFVPPLSQSTRQARTYSGVQRMDAIFPNRNLTQNETANSRNWHHLFIELDARMILFEFKNYDSSEISQDEVNQVCNYLSAPMGKLAILVCSKEPNDSAKIRRNTVYSRDDKVILFITKEQLVEMLRMSERGADPSDFIIDLLELFYIQHE